MAKTSAKLLVADMTLRNSTGNTMVAAVVSHTS